MHHVGRMVHYSKLLTLTPFIQISLVLVNNHQPKFIAKAQVFVCFQLKE